jgi:hypothetical protein
MFRLITKYPPDEFACRGDEMYDRVVAPRVRDEDPGKFVLIDIETAAYEVNHEAMAADRWSARCPEAQVWMRRVGWRCAHKLRSPRKIKPL